MKSATSPSVSLSFSSTTESVTGGALVEGREEANTLFQQQREDSTHGYHQMVSTEIRLIIFFVAKGGEALYSQQKQHQELIVAQIMNSLFSKFILKL